MKPFLDLFLIALMFLAALYISLGLWHLANQFVLLFF
jgi:hypothetical protein